MPLIPKWNIDHFIVLILPFKALELKDSSLFKAHLCKEPKINIKLTEYFLGNCMHGLWWDLASKNVQQVCTLLHKSQEEEALTASQAV